LGPRARLVKKCCSVGGVDGNVVAVGPFALNLVNQSELLTFLAEFGFLLLMFLSGFEIDFGTIEKQGPKQLILGTATFAITLGLSYWLATALGYRGESQRCRRFSSRPAQTTPG